VSTTWYTNPCARTTFKIIRFSFRYQLTHFARYEGNGDRRDALLRADDDIVRFGQKFRLVNCTGDEQFYLQSLHRTPTSFSKISRNQEVNVTSEKTWNSVWLPSHCIGSHLSRECVYVDHGYRLEMEGQPVTANAPLYLQHAATNNFMASDKVVYRSAHRQSDLIVQKRLWRRVRGLLQDLSGHNEGSAWPEGPEAIRTSKPVVSG
jgi:hypothetical protein